MAYVAASRVKDPTNLTLLGDVDGIKLAEVRSGIINARITDE
jgi:hypothetical protein